MYKEHFGLKEMPFSIAPDPRFLYMSEAYQEALAHLMYGIESEGGFVLLTGEVGTGKTTICRCLLEQLPENIDVAFILNPKITSEELLATICDELSIYYPEGTTSTKIFIDKINEYLLDAYSKGRKTVLIIEEAQNLSPDVLEQVRLLTNLETNQSKLLQIIMIGQPELKDLLARPELRQLSQRITARYHLGPLSKSEIKEYIAHRLDVAGTKKKIFPDSIIDEIYQFSKGIPRLINVICDRALLGTYVQGKDCVDKDTLKKASFEIFGEPYVAKGRKKLKLALAIVFIIITTSIILIIYNYRSQLFVSEKNLPPLAAVGVSKDERIEDLSQLSLDDETIKNSKQKAMINLLIKWGIPFKKQENSDICRIAENNGLRCFNKKNITFNELIKLNKPAVLKLSDDKGREFYATLIHISGDTAKLSITDEIKTVYLREIEKRWLGDHIILWNPPSGFKNDIYPGHRGPFVEWIREKISIIQGQAYKKSKDLKYDGEIVEQIKKFQLDKGLKPDGIVGPETIIHINNSVKNSEPQLVQRENNFVSTGKGS